MTKRLAPIRRAICLLILSTFFLETTVIAEVRMLQSLRPVHVAAVRARAVARAHSSPPSAPQPGSNGAVRLSLSNEQQEGNGDSRSASTSADGRWTAFESNAKNLVPQDNNRAQDVFVRDRLSSETTRVSVGLDGGESNQDSGKPSISGDGRFVAFESLASNLVEGDTNRKRDVFVHDRESGVTERVSTATNGTEAKGESGAPAISSDGRFVAFESKASNLNIDHFSSAHKQIYVHDRLTGETTLVSVSSHGEHGNDDSNRPAISGDGRFVAFASEAKNLVTNDTNRRIDIFVHDRETGETLRVSLSTEGVEGDRDSTAPDVDDTGRFVAFISLARNLVPGDTNGKTDVFLHDRATGETTRASVSGDGGQGNRDSGAPSISAGGRFVAFESYASNLVDDDRDDDQDVFVHDRGRGLTIRLTVGDGLGSAYRSDDSSSDDASDDDSSDDDSSDDDSSEEESTDSSRPAISADGRYVSFDSGSANLVSDDTNRKVDVFQTTIELNRSPDAVDDEATTRQGVAVDIHVLANDTDPDGDALSIEEPSAPIHGTVDLNLDDTLTYTPKATFVGTDRFTYAVSDGHGATDSAMVMVHVTALNQPPQVDAGPDEEITLPNDSVTLSGMVTDDGLPEGADLVISWAQVEGPAPADIATPEQTVTIVTLPEPGDYVFELSGNDGEFASTDRVAVRVHPPSEVSLSVVDAVVTEPSGKTSEIDVEVRLSSASTAEVTVDFGTLDGTALADCDYVTRFGSLTFAPGETSKIVDVTLVGDLAAESAETLTVVIGNAVGALIADDEGVVTIEDDDAPNDAPARPGDRIPADGATGIGLDPVLSWTSSDINSDSVTHDVYFGTTFGTTGQAWTELCARNAGPGPRAGAAAAYDDAGDRLIVFGGEGAGSSYPDDVWILSRATGVGGAPDWMSLDPAPGPMGRQQAAVGYDAVSNRLIVHGGCTGACDGALSDTWVLTNANGTGGTPEWIRLPDAPVARAGAAYAYDRTGNRLIVFGGREAGSGFERNDTWVLNDANGVGTPEWEAFAPAGVAPSPRSNASGVYDTTTGRFTIFGGRSTNDQVSNEVWSLGQPDGVPEWTKLEPSGTPPAPRWGHVGFYDETTRRLLVFGGSSAGFDSDLNFVANDLWMLTDVDGGASPTSEWIRLTPERGPPLGRLLSAAAYSPGENSIVIYSGKNNRASLLDDLVEDHWVASEAMGSLPLVSEDQIETTFDTITPGASDTYFWRVVSRDEHGASAGSPPFPFRPNAAPTVDAGPDQLIHLLGVGEGSANLVGSVSDDDLPVGRTLTFAWSLVSGPDGLIIEEPNLIGTAITIQEAGTYVLRLTASDSELEGFDDVTARFVRNAAPIVNAGPDGVIEIPTDTVALDGTVSDDGLPPGSVLAIEWSQMDGPGNVTFSSPQAEDTDATFSALGVYTLRLTASDSDLTVSDEVQVAFTPRNQPPQVDAGPDQIVSPNLIRNPGAEDPLVGGNIPQWTEVSGSSWTRGLNNDPFEGEAHFFAGTAPGEVELAQDIDISALAAAVDTGTKKFQFIGYVRTFDPDTARIIVEYRDAANTTVLDTFDTGAINSHQVWLRVSDPRLAPPGTRSVRIRLISNRLSGSSNDGYFDALSLYAFTDAFQASTTLAGAVQDDGLPFGAPLTTAWAQTGGPGAATLTDPASAQSGAVFTASGDYVFELEASDTELTVADSVSVSVRSSNLAPAVDAGPDQSFALENAPIGLNLLANPGNDLPLVNGEIFGWEEVQGTEWTQRSVSPAPQAGDHYFYAGNGPLGELRQDIDVSDFRAQIDAGAQSFRFVGYVHSFATGTPDTARVVVEYRDQDNADILDVFDSGPIGSQDAWHRVADSRIAPAGTGFIRVRLISKREAGSSNDGYFDSLQLYAPSGTEIDLDGLVVDDGLPAGAALSSTWSLVSGPDDVAFEDASLPASKVTLDVEGEYVLRLTATDTELSNHDEVTHILLPGNRAPRVDAGPDQLLASTGGVAFLQGFVVDDGLPEASVLTTVWTVSSGPGDVVFSSAETFDTEVTFSASGVYVLRLTADDGELSGFDELTVTVDGPNQAPVVDAGPDQTLDGMGTVLPGSAADDGLPIGSVLVATWTQLSGPGTAQFANAFSPTTSVSFDAQGEYRLQLQASDSLLTAADEVVVDVAPAVAPPDLTVGAIDVGGATFDAQTLALGGSIAVEVLNVGLADAMGSFEVAVFEDRNLNGSFEAASDNLLGTAMHEGGLPAGETAEHTVPVAGVLEFFANPIHVFVDRDNVIAESREDNNIGSTEPACNFVPPVLGPLTPIEDWTWDSSEVLPNRIDVISTPIVIDLDVDGRPEVLFTSRAGSFGTIRVLSGIDGTEIFVVDAEGLEANATSPLAAGDIDRDGFPEIIAVMPSETQLMALEHDGTLKWLSGTIESMGHGGAAIADLDGDGLSEIVVGRQVLNNDGSLRWTGTGSRTPAYGQVSLVADLDRDGSPEIVAGNTAYRATGSIFWQNESAPAGFNAVGNFDADPFPEVVVVASGEVWLLEHTGEVKWGPIAHPGGGFGGPPTVADFDGDGSAETGVAGSSAYAVLDSDGTVLWESETQDNSSSRTGSSVFDFEGDGAAEVVYADEVMLRVYRGTDGTLLFEERVGNGTTLEYPVIADIDNDGASEILVAGDRTFDDTARPGIHAYGGSVNRWLPTRPIWNQHTYHITNINGDGTIPEREVNNWEVFNNYRQNVPVEGCLAAQPDLTASFARKVVDGTEAHITVRIGNGGGAAVGPQIPVALYDGDPSAGGVLLATATVNSLTARGFQDLEVTVPVGTQALPLWVVADDEGGLTGIHDESDETNNALNSRLFLTATPNQAPIVHGGEDQVVTMTEASVSIALDGAATDDDLPIGVLNTIWGQVSGPVAVTFADPTNPLTLVTFSEPGEYVLRLTADDLDLTGSDEVTIIVVPPNQAPIVDAGADQATILPADTVTLAGSVSDDGLPLGVPVTSAWSVFSGPGAVAFGDPSSFATTATFVDPGTYVLLLTATDTEFTVTDDVTVTVFPPNEAPVVNAGADQTIAVANTTLEGSVTDEVIPAGSLEISWSQVSGPGVATFVNPASPTTDVSFSTPGAYTLRLTAFDGVLTAEDEVVISIEPAGPAPVVAITSPTERSGVTAPTEVLGTVQTDVLDSWTLALRRQDAEEFTPFASGTTAVDNAVLGTFDPTLLLNGLYEIRLTATDQAAQSTSTSVFVVVKENLKVGHFTVSFVDLEVPVAGLPIRITRTYDSRDKRLGDFGFGWTLDIEDLTVGENGAAGESWQGQLIPGPFLTYCLAPVKPSVVSVTFPNGEVHEFQPIVTPSCQQITPMDQVTLSFRALPGTHSRLVPADGGLAFVIGSFPGSVQLFNPVDFSIYDPNRYRLILRDGREFLIDQDEGLKSLTDLNGNQLTISQGGITHSSGQGVVFGRDAEGRIESVTDPEGNVMLYRYDGNGDLESYSDREDNTTSFTYLEEIPHHLDGIEDPRGILPIRNEYDPETGRLIRHTDAFGKTIEYTHDLVGRQEIIQDREGKVRVLEYDDRGNVLRETDPNGNIILRTFDEDNNRLSETDAHDPGDLDPPTTFFTYDDRDNQTGMTDPEGNTTEFGYNDRDQVETMRDPRQKVTTNVYDANGNLTRTIDALGNETTFTYDGQGNVETQTVFVDGEACVSTFEYDTFGNLTRETDPLGNVTTYTYDRNGNRLTETRTWTNGVGELEELVTTFTYDKDGRLLTTEDPDGTFTETVYDALGKQVESYDKLRRKTTFEYDAMGQIMRVSYPDGTSEVFTYDAEGRRKTARDRDERTTTFDYDDLGRLVRTTFPDNTFTRNIYDAAGRLVETEDARGQSTHYEYDQAGRRIRVTDPLGNATHFDYDENGNQVLIKDAKGQDMTFEYDDLNRRTRTIFADGTFIQTDYDSLGRRIREIDQEGKATDFEYDCLGRLTKVIDALGQETVYRYDELGNRIEQQDANGHVTRFTYDELGREIRRTLPDGKFETRSYDAVGNLKTRGDFNGAGTVYDYDVNNRLLRRTYPDGTFAAFTYTRTGQREMMEDARGITAYSYDSRDRLASLTYPDGRKLEYGHDANGNRTSLTATIGATVLETTYAYDAASRLDMVTDNNGGMYNFDWDANGNRELLTHPNGTSTTYTYDTLNRLRTLTTEGPSSTIQSYIFTPRPGGHRERIEELDGTVREYQYDDLYRLTNETVTNTTGLVYEKVFEYDPVGNREVQTTTGLGAGVINYTYDDRDRLLTENGTIYGWDDNGNLTSKSAEATYFWDFENRLVRVEKTDGTVVTHAYDADGNRVRTEVTPATGPPTVTDFLVDPSGSLSHVVAETDDTGNVLAHYVRGVDDLLAVIRPTETRYYHADGLGSIRFLTDELGNPTDSYEYTAFGEQLGHLGTDVQPYQFAGEPFEPNAGLYYNRARWLDASVGRFVTRDPAEGLPQDPRSLHPYLYAHLNPLSSTDPSGRFTLISASTVTTVLNTINLISRAHFIGTVFFRAATIAQILTSDEKDALDQAYDEATALGWDLTLNFGLTKFVNFTGVKLAGSLFRKLPSMISRIRLWQVAHANGRLAEHFIGSSYGMTRNTTTSILGRLPDFIDDYVIRESKNVSRLNWSGPTGGQLGDLAVGAVQTGRKLFIHVRPGTKVSQSVIENLNRIFGRGSRGRDWDIISDIPESLRVIP